MDLEDNGSGGFDSLSLPLEFNLLLHGILEMQLLNLVLDSGQWVSKDNKLGRSDTLNITLLARIDVSDSLISPHTLVSSAIFHFNATLEQESSILERLSLVFKSFEAEEFSRLELDVGILFLETVFLELLLGIVLSSLNSSQGLGGSGVVVDQVGDGLLVDIGLELHLFSSHLLLRLISKDVFALTN